MKLRERLNGLPEQLGFTNSPTDKIINGFLMTAVVVLEALVKDLEENEPEAINQIRYLQDAIEFFPTDCNDVKEIDEARE